MFALHADGRVEVYCCKSAGVRLAFCNTTKNYTDTDTSLVVSRAKFRPDAFFFPKAWDGQVIRDVDQWRINGCAHVPWSVRRSSTSRALAGSS